MKIFLILFLLGFHFLQPALAQKKGEFIPEPMGKRSVATKANSDFESDLDFDLDFRLNLTQDIANQLNKKSSLPELLQRTSLSEEKQNVVLRALNPAQIKEKLTFKTEHNHIVVSSAKLKSTVEVINAAQERFFINDYEVNLFTKTDGEKLLYIKKVLKLTLKKIAATSAANSTFQSIGFSFFSLIMTNAHAENKLLFLDESELLALGIGIEAVTNEAKDQLCHTAKENFAFASKAASTSIVERTKKNLSSYFGGDENLAQKDFGNPLAQSVGVSFWCETPNVVERKMTHFHVNCSENKEIESISYGATLADGQATPVGFIRKTKGAYWFGTSAASVAEKVFPQSAFIKNVEKCCAEKNNRCLAQMNQVAPMTSDSSNQIQIHKNIEKKARISK